MGKKIVFVLKGILLTALIILMLGGCVILGEGNGGNSKGKGKGHGKGKAKGKQATTTIERVINY
ncbi:MAG: hypothetical protein LBU85_05395 [Treponema sp.]|jgi:hypothetical protein|nr:hypothetical protein [Treponema sp.]